MDISRIRGLCFDIDGTLSDTDDVYIQRVLRYLPRGLFKDPIRAARRIVMWLEAPANGLFGLADRYGVDDEMAAVLDWVYRHRRHTPEIFLLVPGVRECSFSSRAISPWRS